MKAQVSLKGDVLNITISGVEDSDSDKARVARIETTLLKEYNGHEAFPWDWKLDPTQKGWHMLATVSFQRKYSTEAHLRQAKDVLSTFEL